MNSVTDDIIYTGVDDNKLDMFEGQYPAPDGMTYNSYVIKDEKIAVMDTADVGFTSEWLENIKSALGERQPDYLIIHHMEPDHSASLSAFCDMYPKTNIIANSKAFAMIDSFYGSGICKNRVIVSNGETLSLGKHTLRFIFAPMVHWPEVMVSYDETDKILFSADAFGRFGASGAQGLWEDEARRYYIGIVGKYGVQVQALLKAVSSLEVKIICPLHGPVLRDDIGKYIEKYDIWSSYKAEESGTVIAYTSVYGNTKNAAELLCGELRQRGEKAVCYDLSRTDMSFVVAEAFKYDRLILATTTYNADIFPFMRQFIDHLTERNFQKRTVGFIENGSWAPMASKVMRGLLEKSRDITYLDEVVTIRSSVNEQNKQQLSHMADALCE